MRRDLEAMLALADRLDAAKERGVFATLISTRGSSYRPLGSMMLAGPPGTPRAGGVSGGCLEEYIARHGRDLLADCPAALLGFDTTRDGDADLATARPTLGCGGHVDVLIERFTAEHRAMLERLRRACIAGPADCVVTRIEIGPSVRADAHHGVTVCRSSIENDRDSYALIARAHAERCTMPSFPWHGPPARANPSFKHELHVPEARATNDAPVRTHLLAQYAEPQPRLLICGAGNDAQPLATLATMTDWSVTVIDRRARLATRDRFPDVDHVEAIDVDWHAIRTVADKAAQFATNEAARAFAAPHVLLLTHDLADDVAIARALADAPVASIGALGPVHRLAWLRDELRNAGVRAAFIDAIRGPIGLDLGGRSPEQIALAIVAELTALRFARDARPLADRPPLSIASVAP